MWLLILAVAVGFPFLPINTETHSNKVHSILKDLHPALYPRLQINIINKESTNARAFITDKGVPTIEVFKGSIEKLSPDNLTFMLAHELGHIIHRDTPNMIQSIEGMERLGPIGLCGDQFLIWRMKLEERRADLTGLQLYLQAGHSSTMFFGPFYIGAGKHGDLSPHDSHFSGPTRQKYLQKALSEHRT